MRAIRSANSHIKLDVIRTAVMTQVSLYRQRHRRRRILLIDGNAGDGEEGQSGVITPKLLLRIASDDGNADVILCEKDFSRRARVRCRFPEAYVLQDNADAPFNVDPQHRWALWISDPCGPNGHGHEAMAALAARIPSDFVIVFNDNPCARWAGSDASVWHSNQERYLMMQHPLWWRRLLKRKALSQTGRYDIDPNFRCRIMVVTNHLGIEVSREPFQVFS